MSQVSFPITVVYRRTAEGVQTIAFAADLLRRLGGDTLNVYIPPCEPPVSAPIDTLLSQQTERVIQDVRSISCIDHVVMPLPACGVLVDCGATVECEEVDTLYPRREASLLARGTGPILIPFGDSIEAVTAAERGFSIARALTLPVVLYHTTWKDESLTTANPEDHMCEDALHVARVLAEKAASYSLPSKTVIETADDVVEGIVRCAMRESARLIVMSRSSKTTVGCYVDQALKQSPIPILTIAALDRRRA